MIGVDTKFTELEMRLLSFAMGMRSTNRDVSEREIASAAIETYAENPELGGYSTGEIAEVLPQVFRAL